ncbi:hypothetical protein CSPX01_02850, partial [Colletotrichum filicis]
HRTQADLHLHLPTPERLPASAAQHLPATTRTPYLRFLGRYHQTAKETTTAIAPGQLATPAATTFPPVASSSPLRFCCPTVNTLEAPVHSPARPWQTSSHPHLDSPSASPCVAAISSYYVPNPAIPTFLRAVSSPDTLLTRGSRKQGPKPGRFRPRSV